MNNLKCAIQVRGMEDEFPYINEFFDYYISIGFDHFYFINTSGNGNRIFSYLNSEFHQYISILDYSNKIPDWQDLSLNESIKRISEDWVLNIDMDEFLFLKEDSIKTLITNLPGDIDKVHFKWVVCLSENYLQESVLQLSQGKKYRSEQFKTMAKTKAIKNCSLHDIQTVSNYSYTYNCKSGNYLVHFACRGFYDLINRIIGRNYENEKSGDSQECRLRDFLINKDCPISNFPFRLNLYRISLSFPEETIIIRKPLFFSKYKTNRKLLQEIFIKKISSLGIDIQNYEKLSLDMYFENKYKFKQRILKDIPSEVYSFLHFEQSKSYIHITKKYIDDL